MKTVLTSENFKSKAGNELSRGIVVESTTGEQFSFISSPNLAINTMVTLNNGWATPYTTVAKAQAETVKKTVSDYQGLWV